MTRRLLSAVLLLALSGGQLAAGACPAAGSHATPSSHDSASSHDHASMDAGATSHEHPSSHVAAPSHGHASMDADATSHGRPSSHSAGSSSEPEPVHVPCPTLNRCHWLALPSSTAPVTAAALHTLASALPLADRTSPDRADALTPPPRALS